MFMIGLLTGNLTKRITRPAITAFALSYTVARMMHTNGLITIHYAQIHEKLQSIWALAREHLLPNVAPGVPTDIAVLGEAVIEIAQKWIRTPECWLFMTGSLIGFKLT